MIRQFTSVGVVGAGLMGSGIARHITSHGAEVILVDADEARLGEISQRFRDQPVKLTTDMSELKDTEFVIEAVFEDIQVKHSVLQVISEHVAEETVIATNTSSLLVSDLSTSVVNVDRFIGVHYNNPPDFNPIVEIIPLVETDAKVVDAVHGWMNAMQKRAIVCADTPCFILNRQSLPYINEAARCLDIATPGQIDAIACEFLGVSLGPFAVMNLVGLPVMAASSRNLAVLGEGYQPSDALQQCARAATPEWQIEVSAAADESVQATVRDRLLGAMIFPGKDILEHGLCKRDDLHLICIEALGYQHSSADLLEQLSPDELNRVLLCYLNASQGL